jgi:hypothetical protein
VLVRVDLLCKALANLLDRVPWLDRERADEPRLVLELELARLIVAAEWARVGKGLARMIVTMSQRWSGVVAVLVEERCLDVKRREHSGGGHLRVSGDRRGASNGSTEDGPLYPEDHP